MGASKNLGRGFDSLLPQNFDKSLLLEPEDKILRIGVAELSPNPSQPRQHFDKTALEELSLSIKLHGIVQPLIVVAEKGGKYNIVAGERRWRAAKLAGLKQVPAVVRSHKELEQLEIALIENVQRVDLSPLEQAATIVRLHEQFNLPYEAIAERLGKAMSTVVNTARLLQLPASTRAALAKQEISEGHARSILALRDYPVKQAQLLAAIKKNGWSVRQAERYVTSQKEGVKDEKIAHERVQLETPVTKELSQRLGAPVRVRRMARGGRLEIVFNSDAELAKIIKRLS